MRLAPRVLPRARPASRKNRGRRAAGVSAAAVAKKPGSAAAAGGEDEELTRLLKQAEEALAPPAEARDDAPTSPRSIFAPPPAEGREGPPAARSHGKRRSGGRTPMATSADHAAVERGAKKKGSSKNSAASRSSNEARSSLASTSAAAVSSGARPATSSKSTAAKKKKRFQLKSLRRKKPARTGAPPEAPPKAATEPSAELPAEVEKKKAENAETKEEREGNRAEVALEKRPAADEDHTLAAAAVAVAGLAGWCGLGCGPAEERDAAGVGEGVTNSNEEGGVWQMMGAWLSRDASGTAPNDEEVAKAAFVATADEVPAEGSGSRGGEEGSAKAVVAADGKATDSATNDEAKPQPVDAKGAKQTVDDSAAPQAQKLQAEKDEKAQTARLAEMEAQMTAERQRNANLAARIAAQDDELRRMRNVVAGLRADNDFAKQQDASRRSTEGAPAVAAAASLDRGSFDRRPSLHAIRTPDAERWKLQAIIEGLEGDVAAERRRKEEALAAAGALRNEMEALAREAAAAEEARTGREGDARTADRGAGSLDSTDRSSVRSLDTRETDEGHGWFAQFLPAVSEDEESTLRDDLVDWSRSLSTLESDTVGASRTESCELEEEEAEEEAESGLSWTGLVL
ncbi:hypothetical protein ACHAXT_008987 [Thalassiosira profunda]